MHHNTALKIYYADPSYTSELAELIGKDMGLEKHIGTYRDLKRPTTQKQLITLLKLMSS